ncbi:MAG TPA: hypothetical protein VHY22_14845 [Chthoniobacteraceae bacterium]|jgi:hypothetical protein|nr:hypothetical protein [Chthoniobacteraceae bacterium]
MKPKDDNDKLWELLGKPPRQPEVSPFFSRNILRAVRQEEQERPAFRGKVSRLMRTLNRWTWQAAIACTCVAALLIGAGPGPFLRHHQRESVQATTARQIAGNPDYEVIKHLDELVADEESSLWLDDTPVN